MQSVLAAAGGLAPDQIRGIRTQCDGGSQCTSGELGKAMSVLGIKAERAWASTPQQSGHAGSFHNTPRRDYVHTHDFERLQYAEAWPPQAHRDYIANRIHSSIGRVPPGEFLRLGK